MKLYKISVKNFDILKNYTVACVVCCQNIEEAYNLWPEDTFKDELDIQLIGISVPELKYGLILQEYRE